MGCCINEQLFMKVRGNADIEAAFECNFGLFSFCLAGFQNEPVGTGVVAVLLCTRLNYCHLGLARKIVWNITHILFLRFFLAQQLEEASTKDLGIYIVR